MSEFPAELAGVVPLLEEFHQVEQEMSDPDLHSDQSRARRVGRRYAELSRINAAAQAYLSAQADWQAGQEMAAEDPDFAAFICAGRRCAGTGVHISTQLTPESPGKETANPV